MARSSLVAGVTPDLTQKIRAGDLVGEISKIVGGRGGGRPDFAQAGGTDPVEARSRARSRRTAGCREARRNLSPARPVEVTVQYLALPLRVAARPGFRGPPTRCPRDRRADRARRHRRDRGRAAIRRADAPRRIGRIWAPVLDQWPGSLPSRARHRRQPFGPDAAPRRDARHPGRSRSLGDAARRHGFGRSCRWSRSVRSKSASC